MSEQQFESLLVKLDRFIRKYYTNQLIKGGLYGFSAVLLFFLSVTFAEYFGHFDATVRTSMFYGFLAVSGGILVRWVAIPLLKLYRIGSLISYEQAAELIGKHFPNVSDKLTNTLQLRQQLEGQTAGASLLEASIDQRLSDLKPVPFTSAIDLSQNRKYARYALPPLLILLITLFGAPSIITDSTDRLVRHSEEFLPEAPFRFVITNSDLQTGELEDFELEIALEGDQMPDKVFLETDGSQFRTNKETVSSFSYTFRKVRKDTRFRLYADGFYSKEYELKALATPVLLNFEVELDYPNYIGRADESRANTGDLVVPAGTKINWSFRTRNAEAVQLAFTDSTVYSNRLGEDEFRHTRLMLKSESYSVSTENEVIQNRDAVRYTISVVPDQYPSIEVDEKADSTSSKRLYFYGKVQDDYGFQGLYFHYKFLESSDPAKMDLQPEAIELSLNQANTLNEFYHFWDFESLNIAAGDQVEYYFEVWDNDGVNGSKSSKSQRKVFKAPSLDELAAQADANNEEVKDKLEESIQDAKDLQKDLDQLNRKLLEKKQLSWNEKQQLRDLLDKQRSLEEKLDQIKKENKQNQREQSEYREQNERLMEKQRQLEELFDQVMTDEMKQLFDQLEELLEEANKDKVQEMLEDMKMSNEEIEKELDRSLEIFKQLELEQKVEEAIEKLDEIKEKQDDLREETGDKSNDPEALKEKQEELQEEFKELQEKLDEIKEKNEELEFQQDMPDTEQSEQDVQESMEQSSDELQDNKRKKSQDSQKKASDQMQQMSQQMQQMQQSMNSQGNTEDMNALRQILDNLVELSFDQEDLMQNLKSIELNDPQYQEITKAQKKLKDDAQIIEDSLFALSKRVPAIEAAVNREIGAINSNMAKTIKMLSEQPPGQARTYTRNALKNQQYVMTSVNNLALMLDESIQAMQQAISQQKFGSGSCNKPGSSSGAAKPSMQNMKQMQQQISQQIQKLQQQMQQQGNQPGGKQGQKPGMGGQQGKGQGQMSKDLARLAAEQEALRNELRKMAEGMGEGEGENGQGGKGGLDGLQKLMEENERDLVNRNITRETIKRQEEILTKLLESERAEREREKDKKRESKEGVDQNSVDPAELFEDNLVNGREIELLKTVPPSLEPFYKKKVNDYFNGFDE